MKVSKVSTNTPPSESKKMVVKRVRGQARTGLRAGKHIGNVKYNG